MEDFEFNSKRVERYEPGPKESPLPFPKCIPYEPCKKTTSIEVLIPSSSISLAQTPEISAYIVSNLARSLALFRVDTVTIYDVPGYDSEDLMDGLSYLECPQYLRRMIFDLDPKYSLVGLQNAMEAPHQMRRNVFSLYREGVILDEESAVERGEGVNIQQHIAKGGRFVYVGLDALCLVKNADGAADGCRVTVRLEESSYTALEKYVHNPPKMLHGSVVSPKDVKSEFGVYWGWEMNTCQDLTAYLRTISNDRYIVGTSEHGSPVEEIDLVSKFNSKNENLTIVLGPQAGLEELDEGIAAYCHDYINFIPNQGIRSIRFEEALPLCLQKISKLYM